jgi:hypothetical protein
MTKQNKLDDVLKARSSLERQAVKPVDVLETERLDSSDEPSGSTERPNRPTDRNERTDTPNARTDRPTGTSASRKRTVKPNAQNERIHRTVFDDLEEDAPEEVKRQTERYSFEIYTDQKGSIEEVQYLYKKKTGKKLSASRVIREALEEYLTRALEALRQEEQE